MIRLRHVVSLGVISLALAACQESKAPEATASEAAASAPDAKPGLSLASGKLVLPAVKGNPAAAYFELTNNSAKPAVIAAVSVAGAGMAMLHQTVMKDGHASMDMMHDPEVKPGATLSFSPGSNHVMVDGVPESLAPGGTVEITLTFADGDKLSAPLAVVAPGGAN